MQNTIGLLAGILTAIASMPQLIKIIKEKKPTDLSAFMLIILIAGFCFWIWYGILKDDLPILITNSKFIYSGSEVLLQ